MKLIRPWQGPCEDCAQSPPLIAHTAGFSYHNTTKENDVKFMHQSLCNRPISSLNHAIKQNFLKGAPHLTAKTARKYACREQLLNQNQLHTSPHHQAHPYPLATRPCQDSSLMRMTTVLPAASTHPHHRWGWWINSQCIFFCSICGQKHRSCIKLVHERIPIHVPWRQCLIFHNLPLQN